MARAAHPPTIKAFGTRDEKDVLAVLRDPANDVQFIRFFFPDILGRQMDFTIPSCELDAAFKEGKGFDGSSIAGWKGIQASDMLLKADPDTAYMDPFFDEPTLILTCDADSPLAAPLRAGGARVEAVRMTAAGLDLEAVLDRLGELECNEVLVEAGPTLAGEFVRLGLVDEIVVYMAPVVLGSAARSLFNLPPLSRMCDRCEFEWRDVARIGDDLRLTLRPKKRGAE